MSSRLARAGIARLFEAEPELVAHLDPALRRSATRQTVVERLEAAVGVELLGQGDVLPALRGDTYTSLAAESSVKVLEPVMLAVLDREFEEAAAAWPGVLARVLARVDDRLTALVLRLAIAKFPRLEDRLLCVLWQLADRWGRQTADGVHLPLRLSHEVLADLASARRPSAAEAIKRLSAQGAVSRSARFCTAIHRGC